ncbi:E3 ubiquitin-protein ligase RNF12-like [Physella acuta]|uniref:E3 ubiquitin-protein ligase RNF12-like n=1 Tax=Physella acuta TaxID=109671 RepID=UPI0027DD357B|nr:E3 ubiquitin-protein ligase RNF12-like [Physella acuta]
MSGDDAWELALQLQELEIEAASNYEVARQLQLQYQELSLEHSAALAMCLQQQETAAANSELIARQLQQQEDELASASSLEVARQVQLQLQEELASASSLEVARQVQLQLQEGELASASSLEVARQVQQQEEISLTLARELQRQLAEDGSFELAFELQQQEYAQENRPRGARPGSRDPHPSMSRQAPRPPRDRRHGGPQHQGSHPVMVVPFNPCWEFDLPVPLPGGMVDDEEDDNPFVQFQLNGNNNTLSAAESYESLLNLADHVGVVSTGLSQNDINKLQTSRFPANRGPSQQTCNICLSEFVRGEVMRNLPCKHQFHQACIDKWLQCNASCPVCRSDVKVNSTLR